MQYIALISVSKKINIERILDVEISIHEFVEVLETLRKNGCLNDLDGELKVTDLGKRRIAKLQKKINAANIIGILPQYKYFIEKMRITDIYLKE